ncbi:lyase family protein [Halodurantibacterium flavum]|uniref:Lyase family protein n=1 Tax=Halodurantibacterium flavum TaxID=1382802 RepID=A0ABW4S237_9RHOB
MARSAGDPWAGDALMAASALDSAIYRDLFHDADIARLFTDSAEVRAMLLVEGALARAQGAAGLIPETAAAFIHRAAMEMQIDPAGLAPDTGTNAVPVPALVAAFRKAMEAPDHAQYLHWGATSQDIMETALMLRLRQVIALQAQRLDRTVAALATLAETHADLPMAARTYGQVATPTSFGAVVAGWGAPLLRHRDRLHELQPRLLTASLSGAAGTLSVMGDRGPAVRAAMAEGLGLADPGESWHPARDRLAEYAGWMTGLTASLAKMGEDLILLTQSGFGEVQLGGGGASSTMPQKSNPVVPSVLLALGRMMVGLNANMQGAAIHRQQRDGAAWFVEWLTLPQMCMIAGRALSLAAEQAAALRPVPDRMMAGVDDGLGLIHAEALTFALTDRMSRPAAAAEVKALCKQAMAEGRSLVALADARWPDAGFSARLTPAAQLGRAPAEARAFAARARAAGIA